MESLSWEVMGKRWVRSGLYTAAVAFGVWFLWELALPQSTWGSLISAVFRFVLFQVAQITFLLGQRLVVQPEDPSPHSYGDILMGMLSLARAALGLSNQPVEAAYLIVQKIRVVRNNFVLTLAVMSSGFLSLFALALSVKSLASSFCIDMAIRGAALGLVYMVFYTWGKCHVLKFSIIQRQPYYSLKLGIAPAIGSACRIAFISVLVGEVVVALVHHLVAGHGTFSPWHQVIFLVAGFFVSLIWNLCCHFIQVIHTRRYVFAPPPGSAAAETNPTEPLLSVLEYDDNLLLQYLGVLDLVVVSRVSEENVEAWRRAALFEESGDVYKKVVALCLRPLDTLTIKLSRGLETFQTAEYAAMKSEVSFGASDFKPKECFQELQMCIWCANITSSLTAFSRAEDRYGIAQLTGCNGAVLSSLISCLLVLEVYLGRRSSYGTLGSASPNGIGWTVPYRGVLLEVDRRVCILFKKKSPQYKKAHILVDVLKTSIHRIVAAFRDEIVLQGAASNIHSLMDRDWLGKHKPLFGTPEVHAQKLSQFIEFQE